MATFANLSHNVANTITLSFSSSGLTSATSANIVVSPAAFTSSTAGAGRNRRPGHRQRQNRHAQRSDRPGPFNNNGQRPLDLSGTWSVSTYERGRALPPPTSTRFLPANVVLPQAELRPINNRLERLAGSQTSDGFRSDRWQQDFQQRPPRSLLTFPVYSCHGRYVRFPPMPRAENVQKSYFGPVLCRNRLGRCWGRGTIILNAPAGFVFDTGGELHPPCSLLPPASAFEEH